MNENNKKRIEWIDTGKFISIFFVIMSHLECKTDILSEFYMPFFLVIFFFLSGYCYKDNRTFFEFVRVKIYQLLVPWFIFSNLNILLSMIISFKDDRNFKSELLWNLVQIRGHGDGMWFIAALFISFIPFYFLIKIKKNIMVLITVFIMSFLSMVYSCYMDPNFFPWKSSNLPWHIEYIFQAMLWMIIGYYFRLYLEKTFDNYCNVSTCIILWLIYSLFVYVPCFDFEIEILNIVWSYIKSALGLIAMLLLIKQLKNNRFINFVGRNTLAYFGMHWKVYAVLEMLMSHFIYNQYNAILNDVVLSSILAFIITFFVIVLLIIPTIFLNKYFPWMVGKRYLMTKDKG